nr:tetratricopeptide repeat protein [Deltaproteobacteria bacterium]
LEHRAAALTAVVASLGHADTEAVASAPSLLSGLPPIEPCSEHAADPSAPVPWLGEHPDLERRRIGAEIEMLLRPSEDTAEQLQALAEEARGTGDRALLGRVQLSLGTARSSLVSHEAARDVLHQAVRTAEAAGDHETVTRALRRLAIAYQPLDAARFETLLERVAARLEHRPIDAVFSAGVSLSFAHVYALTGRGTEAGRAARSARDTYAEALGPEHPRVAAAVLWIARHLHANGDFTGAREHYAEAARLRTASFGERHPLVLSVLENWGLLEMAAGDHARAVEIDQRLLAGQRERFGPDAPATLWAQAALGGATMGTGEVEAGVALVDAALAGLERSSGAGMTAHAELLYHVAHWLNDAGRTERARTVATRAVAILEASVKDGHPTLTRARTYLRQLQQASP